MFNKNAFKTSIMFLLLIFVGIVARMFLAKNHLFVKSDGLNASIYCSKAKCS